MVSIPLVLLTYIMYLPWLWQLACCGPPCRCEGMVLHSVVTRFLPQSSLTPWLQWLTQGFQSGFRSLLTLLVADISSLCIHPSAADCFAADGCNCVLLQRTALELLELLMQQELASPRNFPNPPPRVARSSLAFGEDTFWVVISTPEISTWSVRSCSFTCSITFLDLFSSSILLVPLSHQYLIGRHPQVTSTGILPSGLLLWNLT